MQSSIISKLFILAVTPAMALYILILVLTSVAGIEPTMVLRDLMQTCELPVGVGMISNLGIILWASASAISLFSTNSNIIQNQRFFPLLRTGGFLSGLLCLDDLFLLHDRQQINQDILYAIYITSAIFILIKYNKLISQVGSILFIITAGFLGLSIISDIFQDFFPFSYETVQIFEEGFKFVGIACWLYFWNKVSIYAIRN